MSIVWCFVKYSYFFNPFDVNSYLIFSITVTLLLLLGHLVWHIPKHSVCFNLFSSGVFPVWIWQVLSICEWTAGLFVSSGTIYQACLLQRCWHFPWKFLKCLSVLEVTGIGMGSFKIICLLWDWNIHWNPYVLSPLEIGFSVTKLKVSLHEGYS